MILWLYYIPNVISYDGKETLKLHISGFLRGESCQSAMDSPHKRLVMWEAFPYHEIIMMAVDIVARMAAWHFASIGDMERKAGGDYMDLLQSDKADRHACMASPPEMIRKPGKIGGGKTPVRRAE